MYVAIATPIHKFLENMINIGALRINTRLGGWRDDQDQTPVNWERYHLWPKGLRIKLPRAERRDGNETQKTADGNKVSLRGRIRVTIRDLTT